MREIKIRYRLQSYTEKEKPHFVIINLEELEMYARSLNVLDELIHKRWGQDINHYKILSRDLYTGQKDKNEKETYERDIVKYQIKPATEGYDIAKIKWNSILCQFILVNKSGHMVGYIEQVYEILGNIYENGDLLD